MPGLQVAPDTLQSLLKARDIVDQASHDLQQVLQLDQMKNVAGHLRRVVRFVLQTADELDPNGAAMVLLDVPFNVVSIGWANAAQRIAAAEQTAQQQINLANVLTERCNELEAKNKELEAELQIERDPMVRQAEGRDGA